MKILVYLFLCIIVLPFFVNAAQKDTIPTLKDQALELCMQDYSDIPLEQMNSEYENRVEIMRGILSKIQALSKRKSKKIKREVWRQFNTVFEWHRGKKEQSSPQPDEADTKTELEALADLAEKIEQRKYELRESLREQLHTNEDSERRQTEVEIQQTEQDLNAVHTRLTQRKATLRTNPSNEHDKRKERCCLM